MKKDVKQNNERILSFLDRFSRRKYSDKELADAEKTANSKYRSKLETAVWDKVRLMFEIVKHPSIWGPQLLVLAVAAVIYLVSPIDAVPDIIPGVGILDDITAIGIVIGAISSMVTRFDTEKKMRIRETIPDDLKPLFDSLFRITQNDIEWYYSGKTDTYFHEPADTHNQEKKPFKATSFTDSCISKAVSMYINETYYRKLSESLINLLIYIAAVFLVVFPIFGELTSSIISALLLVTSFAFAVYRTVRFLRGKHTIPVARSIIRNRSIKRGLSSYIRSLDIRIATGEKLVGFLLKLFTGKDAKERAIDMAVDHCWRLLWRDIMRFVLNIAAVILSFFIVRYALINTVSDLSFWKIVFYPFFVIGRGMWT